jgi:hypothetical protein
MLGEKELLLTLIGRLKVAWSVQDVKQNYPC